MDTLATPLERLRLLRQVIAAEADALRQLADQIGPDAVTAAERIADCRGSVIVTGVGKAGWIGQKWVATLGSTGNRAHFLHPSEAVHGDLGRVGPDDLVVAISNSGRSAEVLTIAPCLSETGCGLIAITGSACNPLAELSDLVVVVGNFVEADPLGLAPTTSTTAILAACDAIAMLASRLVGFGTADFARCHPAGSLGHRLAPVDRMMRPLDRCRVASVEGTVRETMVAGVPTVRRSGAVMLTDPSGRLVGLFTDSDLARLLESRRDDALDRPISEVMTSRFRKVISGTRLVDAIEVLKGRKISELPVIDASGRPLGLLDITDVLGVTTLAGSTATADEDGAAAPDSRTAANLPVGPKRRSA
ncbi:MAG: KpsF/GutQ family sugar-phosphate isomerase [Planctomycetaceae bacterium]|nr:MAG: KpsF/GutQ family sugar-phosphate isomerase [Planctomycetaceae bacterium]